MQSTVLLGFMQKFISLFKKLSFLSIILVANFQLITAQTNVSDYTNTTIDFKVTTLNTEWLSCDQYGPNDDDLQMNNIAYLISVVNPDVIALQEVGTSSSYANIDTIVKKLGSEWAGNIVPWKSTNCSQNQGVIYRKSKVQFVNSSLITNGGSYSDWSSGRYPALYNLNFTVGDATVPVSFINIHAKAYSDESSYLRRESASEGLKTLLDGSSYNTKNIILLGDYNDYLIGTDCSSQTNSPYKNFMDDTADYEGLTSSLYDPYYSSPVIDNIIISNELFDKYVANSAVREVSATQKISNYFNTTTDHTPVSVTLRFYVSTGISNAFADANITLFPNPAHDFISFKSDVAIQQVTIFNIAGAQMLSVENTSDRIDISQLPQGIYVVQLKTENGTYQKKLVKY